MDGDAGRDGLRQGLDSMVALESQLEESLALSSSEAKGYLEAPTILGQLHSLVSGQRAALQAHLEGLGETDVPPAPTAISTAFEGAPDAEGGMQGHATVAALRAVARALTETAFGYTVLHALAHRSYDVATADLADQHRVNYLQAVLSIQRAVADVAVQELQEGGFVCRCECPSCSPGICLCWHVHAEPGVAAPGVATEGIVVRTPRRLSNAERAGLHRGDVILAVDGQEIRSYQDMLDRMRDRKPGEDVTLRIRRATGEPQELVFTR